MAMGDALGKALLKVGAVVLSHRFKFPDEKTPKFCVLLEDYNGSRETTIVALTTTNFSFQGKPWTVHIPAGEGGLPKECLLDCNNCPEIPTLEITSRKFRYKGQFSEVIVDGIYAALEHAYKVPEDFLLRIFGY